MRLALCDVYGDRFMSTTFFYLAKTSLNVAIVLVDFNGNTKENVITMLQI
jgi:hypothetical protein